jgi:hypothetical protein
LVTASRTPRFPHIDVTQVTSTYRCLLDLYLRILVAARHSSVFEGNLIYFMVFCVFCIVITRDFPLKL